jgi:hypothetical protein
MPLLPHSAARALGGHESGDGAARYRLSIAPQRLPHFSHAVHAAMPLPHAPDPRAQDVVAPRPRGTLRRSRVACAN